LEPGPRRWRVDGGVAQGPRVFDHPQAHWTPEVYGGIAEAEAAALLKSFFAARR
jgi:cytidine deaminase